MYKNINEKAAGNGFFDSKLYQWIRNLSIISFIVALFSLGPANGGVESQTLHDPVVALIDGIYSMPLFLIFGKISILFFMFMLPAFFYTLAIEKGRKLRAFLNAVFLLIFIVFMIKSIIILVGQL